MQVDEAVEVASADAVERLIRALRNHAQREDALMYRWAYANLHEDAQRSIVAALRNRVALTFRARTADENRRIT